MVWSKYANNETTKIFSTNSSGTYMGIYHNTGYLQLFLKKEWKYFKTSYEYDFH